MQALQAFNRAASEKRGSWQRALPLEMALVESTPFSHRPPQATMSGGERAGAGAPEEAPPSAEEPPRRVKDELTPQMATRTEEKAADGEVPLAEAPSGEAASAETLADEGQPEEKPPAEPGQSACPPSRGRNAQRIVSISLPSPHSREPRSGSARMVDRRIGSP